MSVYQVVQATQAVSPTTSTGTATFSLCTTNVFQIDNTHATVYSYVNVFTTNAPGANGFNHAPGISLVVPPGQGRLLVGNFAVTGGGQTLYVNHITASGTGSIIITPVSGQRDVSI
jgi:hypothetical protein